METIERFRELIADGSVSVPYVSFLDGNFQVGQLGIGRESEMRLPFFR
jgi:hypothetical protein